MVVMVLRLNARILKRKRRGGGWGVKGRVVVDWLGTEQRLGDCGMVEEPIQK